MPPLDPRNDLQLLAKTQPEIFSVCNRAESLRSELYGTIASGALEPEAQKANIADLLRSMDGLAHLAHPTLAPTDKVTLARLSDALRPPGRVDGLREVRETLQSTIDRANMLLAHELPSTAPATALREELLLRRRVETLQAANEMTRAAEVALHANGAALKHAGDVAVARATPGISSLPGGLGHLFAARLQDLKQAVAAFEPSALASLRKQDLQLVDNLRFALCEISNPRVGPDLHRLQSVGELLERAAAKNPALEAPAKIAVEAVRLLRELDIVLKAAEALIRPPPDLPMAMALSGTSVPAALMTAATWMAPNEMERLQLDGAVADTERIKRYWSALPETFPAKHPWCAAFGNWCLSKVGIQGPADASNVNSWVHWGQPASRPFYGAIALLNPDNGHYGHLSFVAGKTADGTLVILGGNQTNSVRYSSLNHYYRDPIFRQPPGYTPKPTDYELPLMVRKQDNSFVYASNELKTLRALSPQEDLARLVDLLNRCGVSRADLEAAYRRIWVEVAGGKGEPPPLH
jgi:uncharacterized protein (TIGR02594 family)